MRFLAHAGISPRTVEFLRRNGHAAVHVREQAKRRGVDEATLTGTADRPEQVVAVRPGREVRQSGIQVPEGTRYLVRVFVDIAGEQETVVTVYKTSKVAKYWRVS